MNHIVIVPRPRYMRIPTEVHVYPDRGTMTLRYVSLFILHFQKIFFQRHELISLVFQSLDHLRQTLIELVGALWRRAEMDHEQVAVVRVVTLISHEALHDGVA